MFFFSNIADYAIPSKEIIVLRNLCLCSAYDSGILN